MLERGPLARAFLIEPNTLPAGLWSVVHGRHEIDHTQELNYGAAAKALVDLGFQGYMAHEFVPASKDPLKSLEEAARLCDA